MQLVWQAFPQAACLTVPASTLQAQAMDEAADLCRLRDAVHGALCHVCAEFHDVQGQPVLPGIGLHHGREEGLQQHQHTLTKGCRWLSPSSESQGVRRHSKPRSCLRAGGDWLEWNEEEGSMHQCAQLMTNDVNSSAHGFGAHAINF